MTDGTSTDELEGKEERASVFVLFFLDLALIFLVLEGQPSHHKELVFSRQFSDL